LNHSYFIEFTLLFRIIKVIPNIETTFYHKKTNTKDEIIPTMKGKVSNNLKNVFFTRNSSFFYATHFLKTSTSIKKPRLKVHKLLKNEVDFFYSEYLVFRKGFVQRLFVLCIRISKILYQMNKGKNYYIFDYFISSISSNCQVLSKYASVGP